MVLVSGDKKIINMNKYLFLVLACFICLVACSKDDTSSSGEGAISNKIVQLSTDKAFYTPGETVTFTMDNEVTGNVFIRYRHLGEVIKEESAGQKSWTWTTPSKDYTGYMIDIYEKSNDSVEKILGNIAVDVSSDWTRFPRYGFLSKYDVMTENDINAVIDNLNRYHINGVQYQDWHYKHHKPLAGTPQNPDKSWKDISNRNTSLETVRGYIASAKKRGMKSIFYNLCFGALSDAANDGVKEEWYIFKDKNHQTKDLHDLPQPFFWSDIYLINPGNREWQNYLVQRNKDVYAVFDFDGYQIDQLGNRGTVYDYNGQSVDLPSGYFSFAEAMKNASPDKRLVMNAVSQYGQTEIAQAPVDFLYTEVWGDSPKFTDLVKILNTNDVYSNGKLKTVFAAYMDYNVADAKGYFNTPGVLLTDAVIFAFGGSHLELGEHMLGKEYFPNDNLVMKADLKKSLISYYDFMVAYQNLLRDGETFNDVEINCTNGKMNINVWPPQTGQVVSIGKQINNKQIIHLINMSQANNFDWRDIDGSMPEPTLITKPALQFRTTKSVKKVWLASPDKDGGVMENIEFRQNATSISFKLPSLKYWSMIVVEYN